jgi:hypothetical protein
LTAEGSGEGEIVMEGAAGEITAVAALIDGQGALHVAWAVLGAGGATRVYHALRADW